ncbi:acyltransferase family protein [Demequina sp. NBRC 110055]|uniref:acyltransferase family protein n=1 Tax=Demequina sp. NBRC 110055 TaxID=1570344 RepID=UPI000A02C7C1|nr:acyltransferase family protein [Demequina sp. NBRC 110055]
MMKSVADARPSATANRQRSRDRSLDTAVGLLIVLVVWGHAIAPLSGPYAEALEQWLYMFHMPAFVFLSGYLTRKSSHWSPGKIAARLLFPYAVFQVLHAGVLSLTAGEAHWPSLVQPAWTTWYLLSLLVWRLAAPWLVKIPYLVPVTFVVALGSGVIAAIGPDLSLARTLGFLPFFALGLVWKEEWFARLRQLPVRMLAFAAFVAAGVFSFITEDQVSRRIFFLHEDYADLHYSDVDGIVVRAGVLLAGFALTLAFVSLTGWSRRWLAQAGVASLAIYLLHPLVLYPGREHGYSTVIGEGAWLLIMVLAAPLFAYAVSRPAVIRVTRPLMDSTWWTQRRTSRREASAAQTG